MAILDKLYDAGTNLFNMGMQNLANNKLMAREDTAHQREVADLNQAGLNPLLATGGAAASALTPAQSTGTDNKNARKEQELAQKQLEADIEKTKGEAALVQAQADETKRHNLETEDIQRGNQNWKNVIANALIGKVANGTTTGNETIDTVIETAKSEMEHTKETTKEAWGAIARGDIVEALDKASDVHPIVRGAKKKVKEGVKKVKENGGWKATGQKIGEAIKGVFKKK